MKNNELPEVFTFEQTNQAIRVNVLSNEPWFVAKDVCTILGLKDVSMSLTKLEPDEKLIQKVFVSGQSRQMATINESGLYALIVRSNKPEARKFRKWVTAEVLPKIRKTGRYENEDSLNRLTTLENGISALMVAMTNLTNLIAQNQQTRIAPAKKEPTFSPIIDARHLAFDFVNILGDNIRHIIIDEKDWYSLNDILLNMKVKTGSGQIARKIPSGMSAKIWLYGNTHPAWFCSKSGLDIVMHGSRKLRNEGYFSQIKDGRA